MSVSPLIPLAGRFAIGAARRLAPALPGGIPFAQTLLGGRVDSEPASPPQCPNKQTGCVYRQVVDRGLSSPEAHGSLAEASTVGGDLQRRLADFHTLLSQRMLAAGLDPFARIRLSSDIFGGVGTVDDHADAARIRDLLETDPALADAFRQLVELFQPERASGICDGDLAPRSDGALVAGSLAPTADRHLYCTIELVVDRHGITVSVSG
jgi:hypothetical protein